MEEYSFNLGESIYVGNNTVLTILSIDGDEIQFGINTLSEVSDKWGRERINWHRSNWAIPHLTEPRCI